MAINDTMKEALNTVPEAREEVPGREVLRAVELKVALVEYTDADNPMPRTRLVAILPATEKNSEMVYFLDDKVIGKTAQSWFTAAVTKRLGLRKTA